jgi:hypothetical protein
LANALFSSRLRGCFLLCAFFAVAPGLLVRRVFSVLLRV